MPRPMIAADIDPIIAMVISCGMFDAEDREFLHAMLADYVTTTSKAGHVCLVEDVEGFVAGVAYYQPQPACDRVWDLTMIAVHPDHQHQGHAKALLRHLEEQFRTDDQRLLLIHTSAQTQYDRSRALYATAGFVPEARIRDYWGEGDDLIIFSKHLTGHLGH